jgi:hypothetical protein
MASLEQQQVILDLLKKLRSTDTLKRLFTELNYNLINKSISRESLGRNFEKELAKDPVLFAAGGNNDEFQIIYLQLNHDDVRRTVERPLVLKLLQTRPYALFVFSNQTQDLWHFVNVKHDATSKRRRLFRRIAIGADERLRTAAERVAMLDLEEIASKGFGRAALDIQNAHDIAFDVETVTKQFFNEYKTVYEDLQDDLTAQTKDKRWAHDYALQFLNRCMFIYFIQRKRWLGNDPKFLRTFWRAYSLENQGKNRFFEEWLRVLFFEAFNNEKSLLDSSQRKYLPQSIREILLRAPYLKGGLFTENELDNTSHRFEITDALFQQIFEFFEKYNFTIAEDSPLDQQVAVDPEMIGKVYESLVNVSTEADERGDAGIFYTPRTEIDLMCRLTLVDHLANVLGTQHKNLLYELIFAMEPDEKSEADKAVKNAGLWRPIEERLREITVVDPACGSGSFLVGMLHVIDDLQCRAEAQGESPGETAYERKKRIIGQNLYGVDVMEWAAHVAELRMWLALIIDAEFTPDELWQRDKPLLPHFTFKIRHGDSLVQEIGGLSLTNLRAFRAKGAPALKARVKNLKNEKQKFYDNDPDRKFKSDRDLEQEELHLFRDLLDAFIQQTTTEIRDLQRQIEHPVAEQIDLLSGKVRRRAHQLTWQDAEKQKRIDSLKEDLERVSEARSKLKTVKDVPFVWDIAFVEVFSHERGGFDVVIGNPPYVRQENIAHPLLPREKVTVENKRAYKAQLQCAVYEAFPHFFGYNSKTANAKRKLDAKSDLYIYFYFLSLANLNSKGAFSFITSNSWLDVGYGAELQEFLLKRTHVKLVIDNAAKRSFESADVNTVITLLSPPSPKMYADDVVNPYLDQFVRFVMFKTGFENALSPVLFEEIEEARSRRSTLEFRVFPVLQRELLSGGLEEATDTRASEPKKKAKNQNGRAALVRVDRYVGNKWGGKYLRAPEIYWKVLEKAQGKLVRLGEIAEVRFGIKTGANEFFFLDEQTATKWGIEKEFLVPAIQNLRECRSLAVNPDELRSLLFLCPKSRRDLKGTKALKYIQWGELQQFHLRSSCAARAEWWNLGNRRAPDLSFSYMIDSTAKTLYVNKHSYQSNNFHDIFVDGPNTLGLCAALNSTVFQLMVNVHGRANFGGGLMKIETYELAGLLCVDPSTFNFADKKLLTQTSWDVLNPSDERRVLDTIIFDTLGLTKDERESVYDAVLRLVEDRLTKASSLRRRDLSARTKQIEPAVSQDQQELFLS